MPGPLDVVAGRVCGYTADMNDAVPPLPHDLEAVRRLFDLTGRTALVTGAASGLGRAIAIGLAYYGADVATADLDVPGAERTSQAIRDLGRRTFAVEVDVRSWEQVQRMVTRTVEAFGALDIAFNVPGINVRKPALEMTPDEFKQVIDVNLIGVYHCARAAGEVMVRQGSGRMVNVASMYGHVGTRESAAYTASKHAVVGLTKVLALEWAPFGVRVNALAPGYTRSALTAPLLADAERYARFSAQTPLGRFGEPWEMVGPALLMVSDASTFMTGASLIVDGGWTAP
ncbi:MAG: glucose 1-dehydrogenase [Chloroflexi bacterium]|nr:glucose 1-dehydrogenase [Chloroflexota bacterium]